MLPHNGSHTWSISVDFEAADARGESFRLCGGVGAATLKPRWPMQRQPPTRVTFECVCLPKMTKREGEKIRMLHTFRLLCRM